MATPSNGSGADTPCRGQVRKQPPDEHATKDDMEHAMKQMEDRMNQNIMNAVQTAGAELRHSTMETIRDTMQAMETSLGNCIDRNALDINELTRRMDAFEQTGRQTESQINNLRTAVAAAESAVPVAEALDLEDFDREPDLSIVRLRVQDAITQESLLKAVGEIFKANSKPADYKIIGQPLDKSFVIQLTGATGLVARRARKFLSLQNPEDGWKDFHDTTPDNNETRIYIDKDKNRKQIKKEVLSRKLVRILKAKFPTKDFNAQKRTGVITSNVFPLARISVTGPETHKVEWQVQYMQELGIGRGDIDAALSAATADPNHNFTWG